MVSPTLVVRDPDGRAYASRELTGERLTVGRLADLNDLALEPDPQQLVTRQKHFVLERDGAKWFVTDHGSVNGTFVRRGGEMERISDRKELRDGDVVCVAGRLLTPETPKYWEFRLDDPARTRAASIIPRPAYLQYDTDTGRVYVIRGNERDEITVRPQAHRVVRYMAERNGKAGESAVLCTHDELMKAVWADEPLHTREDLNRIFWEIRKKLEPYGADEIVESSRGLGYRLHTRGT